MPCSISPERPGPDHLQTAPESGEMHLEIALVSVVIPCYRSAGTIRRAVESVYRQTLRPGEVILIDDASPDSTNQVLEELKASYPDNWIKIIRLAENCGPSCARNTGWDVAQYPYIAFLDSDDSWHPGKIEKQYSWMITRPEVALTGHDCKVISTANPPDFRVDGSSVNRIGKYALLLSNRFATSSVMLRRDIPFRFVTGQYYAEDYILWCRILLAGLPVYKFRCSLAYSYKPAFGNGGLSANLWRMEVCELKNYVALYRDGSYSFPLLVILLSFSWMKHLRRFMLTQIRYKKPW